MWTTRLAGLCSALALMLTAAPAGAITARHPGSEPGCFGSENTKKMAIAREKLADPKKVKSGLSTLRMQGDAGCLELVDWLSRGAAHAYPDQLEEVVEWVGRSDVAGGLEQTLIFANSDVDDVREEALEVLEERLVELSAEEADLLVASAYADVRHEAVAILAGHHSVGEIQMVRPAVVVGPEIPMWVEVEFWGADSVPRAHEDGLSRLAADEIPGIRQRVAEVIGRMMWEGLGSAPSYGGHLFALAGDTDEDVAEATAKSLGMASPTNGMEILDVLLARTEGDLDDLFEELMDGLDEAVDEGRVSDMTVQILRKLETNGPSDVQKSAGSMAKKAEKKLAKQK
jgi:hypothetical protein